MKIRIEKQLEAWWAGPDEFAQMSDAELMELMEEDIGSAIEGAQWTFIREQGETCEK